MQNDEKINKSGLSMARVKKLWKDDGRTCMGCGEKGHNKNSLKCLVNAIDEMSKERQSTQKQTEASNRSSEWSGSKKKDDVREREAKREAKKRVDRGGSGKVNNGSEELEIDIEVEDERLKENSGSDGHEDKAKKGAKRLKGENETRPIRKQMKKFPADNKGQGKVVKPNKGDKKTVSDDDDDFVQREHKWEIGTLLEAQMGLPNDYEDTYHPVRVIGLVEGKAYRCQFLAFDLRDTDVFQENELLDPREAEPDEHYVVGEAVHVKLINRKVNGKVVDGRMKREGVWVKGTVLAFDKTSEKVKVKYNNCNDGTDKIMVNRTRLRKAH